MSIYFSISLGPWNGRHWQRDAWLPVVVVVVVVLVVLLLLLLQLRRQNTHTEGHLGALLLGPVGAMMWIGRTWPERTEARQTNPHGQRQKWSQSIWGRKSALSGPLPACLPACLALPKLIFQTRRRTDWHNLDAHLQGPITMRRRVVVV